MGAIRKINRKVDAWASKPSNMRAIGLAAGAVVGWFAGPAAGAQVAGVGMQAAAAEQAKDDAEQARKDAQNAAAQAAAQFAIDQQRQASQENAAQAIRDAERANTPETVEVAAGNTGDFFDNTAASQRRRRAAYGVTSTSQVRV